MAVAKRARPVWAAGLFVMSGNVSSVMEGFMRKCLIFLLAGCAPHLAWAQERDVATSYCMPVLDEEAGIWTAQCTREDNLIVVPGHRRRDTGQPVTVIDRATIEAVQGADITRVLERAPSVTFSRNGPMGGFTGIRVRGGEAEQLLVVVDGVRVADVASPGGGYDFGNLLPGNIERIELLRGSNSTLWGSQALAGVLAVETLSGDFRRFSVEGGSRETLAVSGSAGIERGSFAASLFGSLLRSDGFSAAASGSEADDVTQSALGGNIRVPVAAGLLAFANANYARGELEIDGFAPPTFAFGDSRERQETRQFSGRAGLQYDRGPLRLVGSFQRAETERDSLDPRGDITYSTEGISERAELRGRYELANGLWLQFGGESEWRSFSTVFDAEQRDETRAGFAQLDWQAGSLDVAFGARVDDHSTFGGETSLGGDVAWRFAPNWRARVSFGEGFKAPTLFQLFSDFGNRTLRPERSESYDAGVEFETDRLSFAATLYRRDTENLIDFVSCFGVADGICVGRPFGTYDNVGEARAQGVELEAQWRPVEALTLGGVYGYVEAINRTPGAANEGNDLARRPRHAATLSADWEGAGFGLGADLRVVSAAFDNASNATRLDGYEVLTLRATARMYEHLEAFGRVENVFDKTYQTAAGYNATPRGVFVGLRSAF